MNQVQLKRYRRFVLDRRIRSKFGTQTAFSKAAKINTPKINKIINCWVSPDDQFYKAVIELLLEPGEELKKLMVRSEV